MSKTVMINADKARNLKYGINALIELEELLERPLTELEGNTSIKDLRVMLFVGLKWEDKKLTLEGTGDVMDEAITNMGFEEISKALGKAMELAFGGTAMPKDA